MICEEKLRSETWLISSRWCEDDNGESEHQNSSIFRVGEKDKDVRVFVVVWKVSENKDSTAITSIVRTLHGLFKKINMKF